MFLEGGKYIKNWFENNPDKKAEFNTLLKQGMEGHKDIIREHIGYFGTKKANL